MTAVHSHALQQTYKQIAAAYNEYSGVDTVYPYILEHLDLFLTGIPKGSRILDLGAGTGRDSHFLQEKGYKPVLFDMSEEMLAIAKKQLPEVEYIVGDMTLLPFKEASFDGIWANSSLLHLTKAEARHVLARLYEILNPDGKLYICMKKGEGEKELEEFKYGEPIKRFFSLYELEELENIVEDLDFELLHSGEVASPKSGQTRVFVIARK